MSFETWSTNGYGIITTDINLRDMKSLWNLIDMDEPLSKEVRDYLKEEIGSVEDATLENITDYTCDRKNDYRPGIASVLSIVIQNKEGLALAAAEDAGGNEYLMLLPHYSWEHVSDKEENLTISELQEIIKKYVSVISDEPIYFGYYCAVEYG